MHSFIALVASVEERHALTAVVGERALLCSCATASELRRLAGRPGTMSAIVADLRDAEGASTAPVLHALQCANPSLPILISLSLSSGDAREAIAATAAGLRAIWVLRHFDSLASAVGIVLDGDAEAGPSSAIIKVSASPIPPAVRPFLVFAAIVARQPVTVRDAARVLHIAPRSLESQLQRAGLPTPQQVLGWCRALHVAWHLDVLNRTNKQIVATLRFSSQSALCNLVARFTGSTPTRLRELGGFPLLLERFVAQLTIEQRGA